MFTVLNGSAKYVGDLNAPSIVLAIDTAKRTALEQDITEFVVAIPNAELDIISQVTRLIGVRGIISSDGANGVTLTYKFTRITNVMMTGAPTLLNTVSETIDLTHRRVISAQPNGIESI